MHRLMLFVLFWQLSLPLIDVCPQFGTPTTGTGYDNTGQEYTLGTEAIRAVLDISTARSFWVGYEQGGFAWPANARPVLSLSMWLEDGGERWLDAYWSPDTPDLYYVLAFYRTDTYTDANGQHEGQHPCQAVLLTAADYDRLIDALEGE